LILWNVNRISEKNSTSKISKLQKSLSCKPD
jgi:hypothetical protein